MNKPRIILVVCSGNIHRSVIAEHCINRVFQENGLDKDFLAVSRGLQKTSPPVGKNLEDYQDEWLVTRPILQEIGIDISDAKSTPVDLSITEKASLILAMDRSILIDRNNSLINQFPKQGCKMRLFMELIASTEDVPDCFGSKDSELHRRVIELIHSVSTERFNILLNYSKLFKEVHSDRHKALL